MPVYGKIRRELSTVNGLQWVHRPSLSLLFYGIKTNHPLLNHPKIRKALSAAIDRRQLVETVYSGQFEPAHFILPPGMPGYHRGEPTVARDVSKDREFIASVVEKDKGAGQPLEIVSAIKSSFAQAELNFIREAWERLGIPVNIRYITDWKSFEAHLKSDAAQIYRYAWFADMPDPDSFLHPLFASDSPVNFMGFHNPEVDRMLHVARGIIDPAKRAEMYQQVEHLVLQSAPLIPICYLSVDRVYQPQVRGIEVSALGAHSMSLHGAWLADPPLQK